jgi:hypothetical protein
MEFQACAAAFQGGEEETPAPAKQKGYQILPWELHAGPGAPTVSGLKLVCNVNIVYGNPNSRNYRNLNFYCFIVKSRQSTWLVKKNYWFNDFDYQLNNHYRRI